MVICAFVGSLAAEGNGALAAHPARSKTSAATKHAVPGLGLIFRLPSMSCVPVANAGSEYTSSAAGQAICLPREREAEPLRPAGPNVGSVRFVRASVCAAMFAVACGPVDQSGGAGAAGWSDAGVSVSGVGGPPIHVRIVSPADGEKCEADAHGSCGISVAVSGATLAAPGRCGEAQRCGHIDLYIG